MTYDIFISYKRRDTSSAIAALVYNYLSQKGYKVFFDRKEIRQGRFNEQLYNHIEAAKDIIILLEESSLRACFSEITDAYKTDWFCKEVMHALEMERDKHIIPILLGGYKMPEPDQLPEELKLLPLQNAISLDASEMDEVFQKYFISQGYLQSKPKEAIPGIGISIDNGNGIADFLFYTTHDCDIYECGEKMLSLSSDNDEEHPYRYSVRRSGEHRFHCINNDTCEIIKVTEFIETGGQKYIGLKWTKSQNLWKLTKEDINLQNDANTLYEWGTGLFWGTTTHQPDIEYAFICLSKSALYDNESARSFFVNEYVALFDRELSSEAILPWLERASEFGSTKAKLSLAKFYSGLDDEKSIAICTEAANEGDVNAMHLLGMIYYFGEQGVCVDTELCVEWFSKAIEKGDVKSMCQLARFYQSGDVLPKDEVKAAQLYELAVDNGYKKALTMLGNCYREGIGVEQNKEKAVELYKRAVESGNMDEVDPWSQYIMGLCYSSGTGVEKDEGKALEWFYKAARDGEGNIDAMFQIGRFNFFGRSTEQNYKQAFHWFSLAKKGGDSDSCLFLGYMYNDGLYVEQDFTIALEYFKKAAEAGIPQAMREVGIIYFDGKGVKKDIAAAVEWFKKGAELGESISQRMTAFYYVDFCAEEDRDLHAALYWFELSAKQNDVYSLCRLGDIYSNEWRIFRNLIPKDMNKAFAYYLKAAKCGYPKAQYIVGHLYQYQDEKNFEPDYEKALYWYEKAAENNYVTAYDAIGNMYSHGWGVEQSEEKALEWKCKAIENGYFISAAFYDGYYNNDIPSQIIDALVKASQNGYKDAKNYLGKLYFSGKVKCEDPKGALDIFTEAANEGDLRSKYQLALLYLQKHYPLHKYLVGYDIHKAKDLLVSLVDAYEENPNLNHDVLPECVTGAYYNLGKMYLSGRAVPKDESIALEYFKKAATNGAHIALVEIVKIQKKNYKDISEFYKPMSNKELLNYALSCFKEACEEMSRRYKEGDREEQDDNKALYWHQKAIGKIGRKTLKQRIFSIFHKSILQPSKFKESQKWIWQK